MTINLSERVPFPAVFDNTMRCAFVNCPRSFFYAYLHHLKLQGENVNLHAGASFAKGVETMRRVKYELQQPTETALASGARELLRHYGDFAPPDKSAKTSDRTLGALGSYLQQYPPDSDHIQPLMLNGKPAIEFSFAHPLNDVHHPETGEPIIYCGRFDMLGILNANPASIFVVDEKTTSQLGATWSKQWELRSQFMGYVWGCLVAGISVQGAIVRGVSILKEKYGHAEAIVYFPEWMIKRWREQLSRDLNRAIACWREGYFDYNLSDICSSYGGCAYRMLCSSPEPENWIDSYYQIKPWDPLKLELGEEA